MTTPIIVFSDFQKSMNTGNTSALLKARARELIEGVSALIEGKGGCNRRFDRYYDTRFYSSVRLDRGGAITDDGALLLDEDLTDLFGLVNNHDETVEESDYVLFPQEASAVNKDMIRLKNGLYWTGLSQVGLYNSIQVTGFWGYGGSFTRRAALTVAANETISTLTIDDSAPFEMGHMLRMGDELMLIDQEVSGLTIHVERGYNGSIPETHEIADGVYLFRADPVARRLANRICKWQSALDDNPLIALVTVGDGQEPIDLSAAPADVDKMIEALKRPDSIGAV